MKTTIATQVLLRCLAFLLITQYNNELKGQVGNDSNLLLPSKYSTVLYAIDSKFKGDRIKPIAGHLQINGNSTIVWEKTLSDTTTQQIILGYSAATNNASATIITEKDSFSMRLEPTRGVFNTNVEWYNFNCERKVFDKKLKFKNGTNSIKLSIDVGKDTSNFIFYSLELFPIDKKPEVQKELKRVASIRSSTNWFSSLKYGVMFHWTAQSAPRSGPALSYQKAVDEFNVKRFVDMVDSTGADYVIFTGNHAEPYFPGPLKNWEKEYPGRTTKRDLIMEISTALKEKNIHFILYLATHVYAKQNEVNTAEFDRLNTVLIPDIGNHYRNKIEGLWLDGFYQSYKTHPSFDFEKFYHVSKTGNPDRLLALNTWLYPNVSQWQDYWAGEVYTPSTLPDNRIIQNGPGKGLPFHSLIVLESDWVHDKLNTKIPSPRLKAAQIAEYISSCKGKGPVTINLGIYQDGTIGEEAMLEMQKIKRAIN